MSHIIIPSSIGINFLGIKFNAGAAWEAPGKRGTSHLMEHLMCKTFDDMRDDLRGADIDHNAYTSSNSVVFHFTGLDSDLQEFSQTLYDRITGSTELWSREAFDTEKSTVLQEYGDTFNDQNSGALSNMNRQYYNYCGPIGLKSDIEAFTYEDSLAAAEEYRKPRLILEVGNESVNTFVKPTEFCSKQINTNLLTFGEYDIEREQIPKQDKTLVAMISKKPVDISIASRIALLINVLTDGLESPMYQEIREKRGLSYFSAGYLSTLSNQGIPMFCASTDNKNSDKLKEVYQDIFLTPAQQLIEKKRFDLCKKQSIRSKMRAERLPHEGMVSLALGNYNPYDNIDNFEYDEAINMFEDYLSINNLHTAEY